VIGAYLTALVASGQAGFELWLWPWGVHMPHYLAKIGAFYPHFLQINVQSAVSLRVKWRPVATSMMGKARIMAKPGKFLC
jgi:hypothetical protein